MVVKRDHKCRHWEYRCIVVRNLWKVIIACHAIISLFFGTEYLTHKWMLSPILFIDMSSHSYCLRLLSFPHIDGKNSIHILSQTNTHTHFDMLLKMLHTWYEIVWKWQQVERVASLKMRSDTISSIRFHHIMGMASPLSFELLSNAMKFALFYHNKKSMQELFALCRIRTIFRRNKYCRGQWRDFRR